MSNDRLVLYVSVCVCVKKYLLVNILLWKHTFVCIPSYISDNLPLPVFKMYTTPNISPNTHHCFQHRRSDKWDVMLRRGTVFRELHKLYKQYACREYLENWPDLVKYCGYREDNIPQLQDLNNFLKSKLTRCSLIFTKLVWKSQELFSLKLSKVICDSKLLCYI